MHIISIKEIEKRFGEMENLTSNQVEILIRTGEDLKPRILRSRYYNWLEAFRKIISKIGVST